MIYNKKGRMVLTGEQERKAVNYALFFLRGEIKELRNTLQTANDPLIKTHLERRLKELESDFEVFLLLEGTFI